MEEQFQLLFDKMKIELSNQTTSITESITNSIMEKMEEKLKPIINENRNLKTKICQLEEEVEHLKKVKKENNIVLFGLKEDEKSVTQLINKIKSVLKEDLDITIEEWEVNKVYRLGKRDKEDKPRPVLLSLVSAWKKSEIMKNKKKLKDLYAKDDFSKEVMEKRKELLPKLEEERKKGNIAYLKHDKLIVKENRTQDKRKRESSSSPQANTQPRKQQIWTSKDNRTNAFDLMRNRSNSLSNYTTNKNQ
ncbi:uncharacterized protein LOC142983255 [Anticarsia gemmatalis]|uniref:uncharacterized protein LOC142983255 n=1 Tax=Anticarsia gemmatalis TaxID=129554 RepID=UPI003F75D45C